MDSRDRVRFATKCICGPVLCLIATGTSLGQESQGPAAPNIEILKLKWDREVRLPRNFDPSVIPTGTSFSDPASRSSVSTVNTDTKTNTSSARNMATSASDIGFPATPGRLPVFYVYSMKVRNTGAKVIYGIAWDYLFIDPRSKAEVSSHQFVSYAKIGTNKTVTLEGNLRSPPMRIVRASDSGKNTHPKFVEQGVIQCILYRDGSVWKSPQARDGACDLLKSTKPANKQKRA